MERLIEVTDMVAREILDSRGNPTLEVEVIVGDGIGATAKVPSGASTGEYEAVELRDEEQRYRGLGVQKAVTNVNEKVVREIIGLNSLDQLEIDLLLKKLDGTTQKEKLGGNTLLGVSMAIANAASAALDLAVYRYIGGIQGNLLPVPMMNILNGGKHAANRLDFQEFMIMPVGAGCFREALRMGTEVYHKLREVLILRGFASGVGDEGGFAPEIDDARQAFALITEAVKAAGYEPGKEIVYAMDAAASELYNPDGGCYYFDGETKARCQRLKAPDGNQVKKENENANLQQTIQPDTICTKITRTTAEMIELYESLVEEFPLCSIEDGLDQNDWDGWKELTDRLGDRVQLVGDDLFVTNPDRLREGIKRGCGNAILIKPNQIGTVSETLETIRLAKENGYQTIISHRSGETEDTFIADLAVAVNAGQIKTGAPCRSERVAKYNRLLLIEEELGSEAKLGKIRMKHFI